MANLAQIYDWFMTGKKPTQAQFWASWGSFWNKEETIPQSAITNLTAVLAAKTENDQFNAHKVALDAHTNLFLGKEDKDQKGAAGGYTPLNEFTKIASEYLNIVNDVVTGGATSLASAETVKTLKTQINAINVLLTSDNLNLDTVQEIVDAIETVQTSLSTILVNDLTTGGTTKALTAEMGKTLKGLIDALTTNKVDKVAGERLINAGEITKLAGLTNVITTVKPILSTVLATQNVAGFVTYINALTAVLTVGANEIVKYNLTDTGRIFQLNLRGRSFGVGQAAIVAAEVLEITDFLNKDIRLSNYPSTRNDGQLPTNRVLSTDANGNLKMYTIATAPAPYLEVLVPDSTLPSTTTNFTLKGAFFTPTMTVVITGQTVNYITFKSDNLVLVNVTTGATEGTYAVTLNNGIQAVFPNALLIVLGTVYTPLASDWEAPTGQLDVSGGDSAKVKIYEVNGTNRISKQIDYTKKNSIRFNIKKTPFGYTSNNELLVRHVSLVRASDNTNVLAFSIRREAGYSFVSVYKMKNNESWSEIQGYSGTSSENACDNLTAEGFEFRLILNKLYMYIGGVIKYTYAEDITENLKFKVETKTFNVENIKLIELAS